MGFVAALAVLTRPGRNAGLILAGLLPLLIARAPLIYEYFDYRDVGGLGKGMANLVVSLARDDAARERLATRVAEDGRRTFRR